MNFNLARTHRTACARAATAKSSASADVVDSTLRHRVDGPAARDDVRTRRRGRERSASARVTASRVTAATRDIATRVIDISGARATIVTLERRVDRVDVDAARTIVTIGSRPRSGECARWHAARRGRCFGHGTIHHKLRGRYSWRAYGDKSGVYTSSVCVLKRTIDRHRARVFALENEYSQNLLNQRRRCLSRARLAVISSRARFIFVRRRRRRRDVMPSVAPPWFRTRFGRSIDVSRPSSTYCLSTHMILYTARPTVYG